jgi:ribosomal protein S18 acetylase RimI-like enzyme
MAEPVERFGNDTLSPDPDPSPRYRSAVVPLTEPDVEHAARLYTDVFLADEPTTRRAAPVPVFFLPHAQFYVRSLVRKDLSFLVRDEATNDLAGFIFCLDLTDDPEREGPPMVEFLAHFPEIIAMMDELEARHLCREDVCPGTVLHIIQIGVAKTKRGSGIAQAMIHRVVAHARKRGYKKVIADCTSSSSQRAFEQCGFFKKGFISYDSFTFNGVRFFAGLDGGISLMVREI